MNFVAGISLSGSFTDDLSLDLTILCPEDPEFQKSSSQIIKNTDLQAAFQNIRDSLPEQIHDITITTPTYYSDESLKQVKKAAKAARFIKCRWLNNIGIIQQSLTEVEHPPRPELLIETAGSTFYWRMVSTEVDGGIRCSDILQEELSHIVQSPESTIVELIDKTLASQPVVNKVLIISSQTSITPTFAETLQGILPSAEIILESDVSRVAAKDALSSYQVMVSGDLFIFNTAPLNVGIAKADGFVYTLIPRNFTLPNRQTAIFTTDGPRQTEATIRIVVGVSPRVAKRTPIAELVLKELTPISGGSAKIKVTLDVEHDRRTHIKVEELKDDGTIQQSVTKDLTDIIGDDMDWDDVNELIAASNDDLEYDEEAEAAANRWIGEVAAGALPE